MSPIRRLHGCITPGVHCGPTAPAAQVIINVPTVYHTSKGTYMAFRSPGLICPAGSPSGADLMSIRYSFGSHLPHDCVHQPANSVGHGLCSS